uniref:DBF4-type domain-containing protein n=1 Tax=Callorhinchus milii TaxID=7868 RepID=A0A4W3HNL1_CALMI|eukprot:gi/632966915/ref/XP_007899684.1/ PREDICTED: protein DBF4 homolog B [Callorhinchus milii]
MPGRCLVKEFEDGTLSKRCLISGKAFYLDLPSNKSTQFLESVLKKLGGIIESFLSKEVNYVVSSSKEATLGNKSGKLASVSKREYWKNSQVASPHPVHVRSGQTISWGKRLLETVIKNNEYSASNSILANARSWGVKILHLDDLLAYVERRGFKRSPNAGRKTEGNGHSSKSTCKGKKVERLKQPFVKVEDSSRQFKPLHQQFDSFPELNYQSPRGSSAFDLPKKSRNGGQEQDKSKHRRTNSEGDSKTFLKPTVKHMEKKRQKFCECCNETFNELDTHLQSEQHQDFAIDSSQYTTLDRIMSHLENEFAEHQNTACIQRSLNSISTPVSLLTKMDMKSLPPVEYLSPAIETLSPESVAAGGQLASFDVEFLEDFNEEIGPNSSLHQAGPDRMGDEQTEQLDLDAHGTCHLQQNKELLSCIAMDQTALCCKQFVVQSPGRSESALDTEEPVASYHLPCAELAATDTSTAVQDMLHSSDKEETEDSCHQDKPANVNLTSKAEPEENVSYCVTCKSWKVEGDDIIAVGNHYSLKKRKRSGDGSSQAEKSPRLDDLANVCGLTHFPKNCVSPGINDLSFQPNTEYPYKVTLPNVDKHFTSRPHSCVEQNPAPSTQSQQVYMEEDSHLLEHTCRPFTAIETPVDFESSGTKDEGENQEMSQRTIWDNEERPYSLQSTTVPGVVIEEILPFQVGPILLHEEKTTRIPQSDAIDQAKDKIVPEPQILNEEVGRWDVTENTAIQVSFPTPNPANSTAFDIIPSSETNFKTDIGDKNSVNISSLCRSFFEEDGVFHAVSFSSESDWDSQLPSRLDNVQTVTKGQPVDMERLRKTCISVKDAEYETQLYSALKEKS